MIYGYVGVWLFCDIVPEQPDAAMKMCLSVIRLFNLSGGTGLSVSLTLANPPTWARILCSRITCAPAQNIFHLRQNISRALPYIPAAADWWMTEKFGKLAEDWWRREGLG